jgi:hypothetical protein
MKIYLNWYKDSGQVPGPGLFRVLVFWDEGGKSGRQMREKVR